MCSCYRPEIVPVPLRNRDSVTTLRLLQRFEPSKAAEAHSIQTKLKVKHVWTLISCAGTKYASLKKFPLLSLYLQEPPFYSRLYCYDK